MSAVIGYHVILSTHGFWLPNDPRGSCSTEVRSPALQEFGPATTVSTHRSVANRPHDRAARLAAKRAMKYPAVVFDGRQALSVANAFGLSVRNSGYRIHACCILPCHAHLVIARHKYSIEQIVRRMRQSATFQLLEDGLHPFAAQRSTTGRLPSVWGQDFWKVFLFSPEDIVRDVRYVEDNPLKEGEKRQQWGFVTPYSG